MANWYVYDGCCDGSFDPNNFRLSQVKPLCNTGVKICAIYLSETTFIPSTIESAVQQYIANALATQVPQPTGVGRKRFVYLRGPVS